MSGSRAHGKPGAQIVATIQSSRSTAHCYEVYIGLEEGPVQEKRDRVLVAGLVQNPYVFCRTL